MSRVNHRARSLSLPPFLSGGLRYFDRAEEGTELETSVIKL